MKTILTLDVVIGQVQSVYRQVEVAYIEEKACSSKITAMATNIHFAHQAVLTLHGLSADCLSKSAVLPAALLLASAAKS